VLVTFSLALLGAAAIIAGSLHSKRAGMFNNLSDDTEALAEHMQTWDHKFPSGPTLQELRDLVLSFGGECTELALSPANIAHSQGKLSCEITVPGQFPLHTATNYSWTLIMSPHEDRYSISELYRRPYSL
jgi:hypothetical protein